MRTAGTGRSRVAAVIALAAVGAASAARAGDGPVPPPAPRTTLVLYDDGGEWGWLGELYAISAANLASHFGAWRAVPVREYRAGDLFRATAAVYVGSTYDAPLPQAFLDDVLADRVPVLWAGDNIWQLARRAADFATRYGFAPGVYDERPAAAVRYKGVELTRDAERAGHLLGLRLTPGESPGARVLATAVLADGEELPWAVRSRKLTYVAENPFTYTSETDRYLAYCDLLFDLLAPATPERHRALVRIEDVLPTDDPGRLRAIADALAAEGVPFAISVVPMFVDPRPSPAGGAAPRVVRWRDVPRTTAAVRYMGSRGGVLVMHGFTHQCGARRAPFNGVSGHDFEFWTAHLDAGAVVLDGPVPEDSPRYAAERVERGLAELARAGLGRPQLFEYPHYAGSAEDSRAIAPYFRAAYQRGLYFAGLLRGGPADASRPIGQLFPYEVTDVYGWRVIPENLGSYSPHGTGASPPRLVGDLLRAAEANRVVRDGFASFFFHPHEDAAALVDAVRGIRRLGYAFVSARALLGPAPLAGRREPVEGGGPQARRAVPARSSSTARADSVPAGSSAERQP